MKFKSSIGGRSSIGKLNGNRLVGSLGSKTYLTATLTLPEDMSFVAADNYWKLSKDGNFSSPIHDVAASLGVISTGSTVKLRVDGRRYKELNSIVRRISSMVSVFGKGGVDQVFKIYYDHFPVNYSLSVSGSTCQVTVNNFLGFKSPILLKVANVLSAQRLDDTSFRLRFTDLDARGTSYKTFYGIKRFLKTKLSKVKFLDCIYPVKYVE